MPFFTKKPITIEARQYTGTKDSADELIAWADGYGTTVVEIPMTKDGYHLVIPTLEGNMHLTPADWLARGFKDEFYPIRLDIMEATYDRVFSVGDFHEQQIVEFQDRKWVIQKLSPYGDNDTLMDLVRSDASGTVNMLITLSRWNEIYKRESARQTLIEQTKPTDDLTFDEALATVLDNVPSRFRGCVSLVVNRALIGEAVLRMEPNGKLSQQPMNDSLDTGALPWIYERPGENTNEAIDPFTALTWHKQAHTAGPKPCLP